MANIFRNLLFPVFNGRGAFVDTSAMGKEKSIVVSGNFPGATITVEASIDGVNAAPVETFSGSANRTIPVVAPFMSINVRGRVAGVPFVVSVAVGANDNGTRSVVLPLPAGEGAGAPVDVSDFGNFTTCIVTGPSEGATVSIEGSVDGVTYAPIGASSIAPVGIQNVIAVANFMRTFVRGTDASAASVAICAENEHISPAMLLWGNSTLAASVGTRYMSFGFSPHTAATAPNSSWRAPRKGTLRAFRVRHNAAGGNGNDIDYDFEINGVPAGLGLLLATNAVGDATDNDTSIALEEGDLVDAIAIKATTIGGGSQNATLVCSFE